MIFPRKNGRRRKNDVPNVLSSFVLTTLTLIKKFIFNRTDIAYVHCKSLANY